MGLFYNTHVFFVDTVSTQLVLSNMIKGPVMLGVIIEYSRSTLMVYLNGVDLGSWIWI